MKRTIFKFFSTMAIVLFFTMASIAQPPPPTDHGGDEDVNPAPIGSGLLILMLFAGAYGAKKVYNARKHFSGK